MGLWSRLFGPGRSRPADVPAAPAVDVADMVRSLAGLEEDARRAMIRSRLQSFAAQEEGQAAAGMGAMLDAALDLPVAEYRRLAASRMAVLMTLPPEQQVRLMKAHGRAVMGLAPEKRTTEMQVMKDLLMELPEGQRTAMMDMMDRLGMRM